MNKFINSQYSLKIRKKDKEVNNFTAYKKAFNANYLEKMVISILNNLIKIQNS